MGNMPFCQQLCVKPGEETGEFNLDSCREEVDGIKKSSSSGNGPDPQQTPNSTPWGDEMLDHIFDPDLGSDDEIEEFNDLKNEQEHAAGLVFSKNGILKHIEAMMEENATSPDPSMSSQWELKCNHNNNIKLYLKKNQQVPFMCIEATFPKKYMMNKLIKVIYSFEEKLKWDSNLQEGTFTPIKPGVTTYGKLYCVNKKQLTFSARDFKEKGFAFFHNDKFFKYQTSCCTLNPETGLRELDSEGLPGDTVRGEVLNAASVMERTSDGKIRLTYMSQTNLFVNAPKMVLEPFMSKSTKTWYDNVNKFYQKNFKRL